MAVWDTDAFVKLNQIEAACELIVSNKADFVIPYDGRFLDTGPGIRMQYLETGDFSVLEKNMNYMTAPYGVHACGGGFIARRETYIECGMENENFYGWGQEDGERVKRWQLLGKRVTRVPGPMFHLYHPRGLNSGYLSAAHREKMIGEYNRIAGMLAAALRQEIRTWPHMQRHLSKLPE